MNASYFTALNGRVNATVSCSELQSLYTEANTAINAAVAAVNALISNLNGISSSINDIITTFSGTTSSFTALESLPSQASSLVTLGQVIAYCQASATVHANVGTGQVATMAKQLIRLQSDFSMLTSQIAAATANLTTITTGLAGFLTAVASKAATFPSCTIS